MRWWALHSSLHTLTAGYNNKLHCMYGLQVHDEFSWDSERKVAICTVAKWQLENEDLTDGSLNNEESNELVQRLACGKKFIPPGVWR